MNIILILYIISYQYIYIWNYISQRPMYFYYTFIFSNKNLSIFFAPIFSSRVTFRLNRIPCRKTKDADQSPCTSRHGGNPTMEPSNLEVEHNFQVEGVELTNIRHISPENWCLEDGWFPFEMVRFFCLDMWIFGQRRWKVEQKYIKTVEQGRFGRWYCCWKTSCTNWYGKYMYTYSINKSHYLQGYIDVR